MLRPLSLNKLALVLVAISLMAPVGLYCVSRGLAFVGAKRETQALEAILEMGGSIRKLQRTPAHGGYFKITFDNRGEEFGDDEAARLVPHLRRLGKVHLDVSYSKVGRAGIIRLLEECDVIEIDVGRSIFYGGEYDDLPTRFPKTKINLLPTGNILIPPNRDRANRES